jgi:antitoxin HigA-1
MLQSGLTICVFRRAIGWNCCAAIEMGNIPYVSISNGVYVSTGKTEMQKMLKSATITSDDYLKNPTAGDVLVEDFLKPLNMSQTSLARAIGVSPRRINEIILGKRAVTADTDLRLSRYWGVSEGFFLGLQTAYDLMEARRKLGSVLDQIVARAA